jgi:subtilisin family serine protease
MTTLSTRKTAMGSTLLALILVTTSGLFNIGLARAQPPYVPGVPRLASEVVQALEAEGAARVIVALQPPTAQDSLYAQSQQVVQVQARVLHRVAEGDFQLIHRYQTLAGLAGIVTPQGLNRLRHSPEVRAIALDTPVYPALIESATLIHADRVWNDLGITGAGVNVAVLDSGIDLTHPDLSDHVVVQHCFTQGACLPNGTNESDNAQDEHGHGTQVAGIITGRGTRSPRGIAPDAGIVAVRVMDGSGWTSDVIAGMDWVVANQLWLGVKIINLSLGSGSYTGICDTTDAITMLYADAVSAARTAGMVVFAAAGNHAQSAALTVPACISGVIAVGSTYDADLGPRNWRACADASTAPDQVACFSNSSAALDLLAPGAWITAAALGGGQGSNAGTSMAAPHAAAVAGLMFQQDPNLTPDEIETVLKETGVSVTDPRNGRVTPRIDALAAVTHVIHAHTPVSLAVTPAELRIPAGGTATTAVQVDGVSDLYSAGFRLTFDPDVVQVVDVDPDTPGGQIAVGELFEGRGGFVARNQVDNAAGVVDFSVSLHEPAAPIEGAGAVAAITWRGQDAGQSALRLEQARLADPDDVPIPHKVESSTVEVYRSLISGVVWLQGRADHSGTPVFIADGPCPPEGHAPGGFPPGVPSVVTDEQGYFEISDPPGDDDRCLWAARHGYLAGQAGSPHGDLGRITLPGGDVVRDDKISILDLALVAARYGGSDPTADVNGDGTVSIFDLTIVAGNYGTRGPVTNWQ